MEPGTLLAGRYRIDSVLASGGMGVVYAARQLPLQKKVAVKVLKPELLKHGPFLGRLQREAHTVATLKHPNIVEVTDLVLEDHLAFLVMELLEGHPLTARIGKPEPIGTTEMVEIAVQILRALEAAHGAGLVHRDVKPDNIFLVPEPNGPTIVKLLDFGLVKVVESSDRLTATNAVLGTWQYMAPEQARGEQADARADLYSLGAVMFYALTKKRPYQAAEMEAPMFALSPVPAPPLAELRPDIDPNLAEIIHRALEKDRLQRWQTAREMLEALSRMLPQSIGALSDEDTLERVPPRSEIDTLPRFEPPMRENTATAIVLDLSGQDALAPTMESARTESYLPSEQLMSEEESEIESVELHSRQPSGKKWKPPRRVNVNPLEEWSDAQDAFRVRAARSARLRRIGLFVALGVFVFASGLILGEVLFR